MVSESEVRQAISEAIVAIQNIVSDAEKFVNNNMWNDVCGQKIGKMLFNSVESAFNNNLKDATAKLQSMKERIPNISAIIKKAEKEIM